MSESVISGNLSSYITGKGKPEATAFREMFRSYPVLMLFREAILIDEKSFNRLKIIYEELETPDLVVLMEAYRRGIIRTFDLSSVLTEEDKENVVNLYNMAKMVAEMGIEKDFVKVSYSPTGRLRLHIRDKVYDKTQVLSACMMIYMAQKIKRGIIVDRYYEPLFIWLIDKVFPQKTVKSLIENMGFEKDILGNFMEYNLYVKPLYENFIYWDVEKGLERLELISEMRDEKTVKILRENIGSMVNRLERLDPVEVGYELREFQRWFVREIKNDLVNLIKEYPVAKFVDQIYVSTTLNVFDKIKTTIHDRGKNIVFVLVDLGGKKVYSHPVEYPVKLSSHLTKFEEVLIQRPRFESKITSIIEDEIYFITFEIKNTTTKLIQPIEIDNALPISTMEILETDQGLTPAQYGKKLIFQGSTFLQPGDLISKYVKVRVMEKTIGESLPILRYRKKVNGFSTIDFEKNEKIQIRDGRVFIS